MREYTTVRTVSVHGIDLTEVVCADGERLIEICSQPMESRWLSVAEFAEFVQAAQNFAVTMGRPANV